MHEKRFGEKGPLWMIGAKVLHIQPAVFCVFAKSLKFSKALISLSVELYAVGQRERGYKFFIFPLNPIKTGFSPSE